LHGGICHFLGIGQNGLEAKPQKYVKKFGRRPKQKQIVGKLRSGRREETLCFKRCRPQPDEPFLSTKNFAPDQKLWQFSDKMPYICQ
jgi:hypothetical protein